PDGYLKLRLRILPLLQSPKTFRRLVRVAALRQRLKATGRLRLLSMQPQLRTTFRRDACSGRIRTSLRERMIRRHSCARNDQKDYRSELARKSHIARYSGSHLTRSRISIFVLNPRSSV